MSKFNISNNYENFNSGYCFQPIFYQQEYSGFLANA